jgi:hypothetical protein
MSPEARPDSVGSALLSAQLSLGLSVALNWASQVRVRPQQHHCSRHSSASLRFSLVLAHQTQPQA